MFFKNEVLCHSRSNIFALLEKGGTMIIKCCLIILAQSCFPSLGEPGLTYLVYTVSQKWKPKDSSLWIQEEFRGTAFKCIVPWGLASGLVLLRDRWYDKQPGVLRTPSCNGISILLLPGDGIFNQSPTFLEKQKRVKRKSSVDRDLGLNHTAY